MSRVKGPKFSETRDRGVETRPYEASGRRERMGRTSVTIWCPFCNAGIEAFVWSLAGGGKRCTCGALFASGGNAYHFAAPIEEGQVER